MYCYVIFGKDKHGNTKKYLCKYNGDLEPGDVIWILDNRIYTALVREVLDELPIDSASLKIQNIFCKNPEGTFPAKFAKSFFLALVDEYKDGEITKEKLTQIMEHFLVAIDSDLKSNSVLIFKFYVKSCQMPAYNSRTSRSKIKNWHFGKSSKIWNSV